MYISLGSDVSVHKNDIIGIFDIEKTSVVRSVNDYLSLDMPKSFVVCDNCVYVTNVSAATLKKREKFS